MDPLSWTGAIGAFLNPIFLITIVSLALALVMQIIMSFFATSITLQSNADGSLRQRGGMSGGIERVKNLPSC